MLLDLLYPKVCFGCGSRGKYICTGCRSKLEIINKPVCMYCGLASAGGFTHAWCRRAGGVDRYMGVFRYNPTLKRIIGFVKYRLVTDAWNELFSVTTRLKPAWFDGVQLPPAPAFLQPVPLHKSRQLKRGFNQASCIAFYFSSLIHLPVENVLIRNRATVSQTTLSADARKRNAQGIFTVKNGSVAGGSSAVLVDDVVTTGATVTSAAAALKAAGAKTVWVLSLAKG